MCTVATLFVLFSFEMVSLSQISKSFEKKFILAFRYGIGKYVYSYYKLFINRHKRYHSRLQDYINGLKVFDCGVLREGFESLSLRQ